MQAMANAEAREADAEQRGDWDWEVSYSSRGPRYGDMVSFQFSFDLPWQREPAPAAAAARQAEGGERIDAERDDTMRRHARGDRQRNSPSCRRWTRSTRAWRAWAWHWTTERVALALASYEAGRGDLGAVLAARREARRDAPAPDRPRGQRSALRVR